MVLPTLFNVCRTERKEALTGSDLSEVRGFASAELDACYTRDASKERELCRFMTDCFGVSVHKVLYEISDFDLRQTSMMVGPCSISGSLARSILKDKPSIYDLQIFVRKETQLLGWSVFSLNTSLPFAAARFGNYLPLSE